MEEAKLCTPAPESYYFGGVDINFKEYNFLNKLKIDKIIDYLIETKNENIKIKRIGLYEGFYKHCKSKECISYLAFKINENDIIGYEDIILELFNMEFK
jgi:hypothetical protein